jgi:cytoplasmic iron level regulating protein YaaA (DUF328/UPF0246 family)
MIILISPAKTLDFDCKSWADAKEPRFLDHSLTLIQELRKQKESQIANLMGLSDKLASLNVTRYKDWNLEHNLKNSAPAALAFQGDVYKGMVANQWDNKTVEYAKKHLRILSGLYGLLRPNDLIQPHRLEMGTDLKIGNSKNLYAFWSDEITELLNQDLKEAGAEYILNLASNEYWKAIKPKKLQAKIISPVFKDCKKGKYKIISFYAKKARGLMAHYILENEIKSPKQISDFNVDGYYYSEKESSEEQPVFLREEI